MAYISLTWKCSLLPLRRVEYEKPHCRGRSKWISDRCSEIDKIEHDTFPTTLAPQVEELNRTSERVNGT